MLLDAWPGIIGGLLASLLTKEHNKKKSKKNANGQLKYTWPMLLLGMSCLALVVLISVLLMFTQSAPESLKELYIVIGLYLVFGIGGIYSLIEYYSVRGSFTKDGIVLKTFWSVPKEEQYKDIVSNNFNSLASWQVLKFKSGATVRLSTHLLGYDDVIAILKRRGRII